MKTAVLLDADTLPNTNWSGLAKFCELQRYGSTSADLITSRLANADIVISNKVQLSAEVLRQLPHLKLICIAATGINNVDLNAARQLGITVCNARDYATHSVAQHAMALLLGLSNQIHENAQAIAAGQWSESPTFCLLKHPIRQLHGLTMTIIGFGNLGQATARLAQAFGMNICIAERPHAEQVREGRVAFAQALAQADVVSLHCPAVGSNFLLGAAELELLKPTAMLINTARGALVDPEALVNALQTGQLAGAALDVLAQEPPAITDVLLNPNIPNLLLSPHVAWASADAMQNLVDQIIENIQSFLSERPIRCC